MKSSNRFILPGQLRLILAVTLVHIVAWFTYYSQIPAGQYADDATLTTLHAAQALAVGLPTDEAEPTLYIYTLSVLARFFESDKSLTYAALTLNAFAFLIAAGCCASAAGSYWQRNRAVWISGFLVGLNPVLVFWAGNISPCLITTACMSFALWRILRWLRRPKLRNTLGITVSLALAAAFETTLLPLALLWPVFVCLYRRRERLPNTIIALLPTVFVCGLISFTDLQLQDPIQWNFDQFGVGVYKALGSIEQYDGKSFAFYRQLHLILLLNPIHWGALFILAGIGIYARVKDGHSGSSIKFGISVLAIFAISSALNDSSSQARASIIPLLALFAAGVALLPKIWRHAGRRTRRKIQATLLLLGTFSYAGYLEQSPSDQWENDYIYLAQANLQLGHNDRAATWAEKLLEINPNNDEMQQLLVIAQFNDWAIGNRQRSLPTEAITAYLENSHTVKYTATTRTIYAIYQYKLREVEVAQAIWQAQRNDSALALLCLYWTGQITEIAPPELKAIANSPYYDLLVSATEVDRNALDYGNTEKQLDNILALSY